MFSFLFLVEHEQKYNVFFQIGALRSRKVLLREAIKLGHDVQGLGESACLRHTEQTYACTQELNYSAPPLKSKLQNKVHFCKHGKNVVRIDVFQTMAS